MAPYTYCQENINIYNTVSAGNPTTGDYIGFISLGYLQTYGDNGANMIGLNIAYNTAAAPQAEHQHSPLIHILWHNQTHRHSSEAPLIYQLGVHSLLQQKPTSSALTQESKAQQQPVNTMHGDGYGKLFQVQSQLQVQP